MRAMSHQAPSTDGLFDVSGKTALVTGGGRGIGLMIAGGLVRAGVRVMIASRKAADIEAAATELSRGGGECEAITADLSTPEGARALAEEVSRRVDALHILVNNSGATWGAPLEEFPASGWDRVIHTNLEGVFHLTVGVLPALRAAASAEDPARVINIGSIDGLRVPFAESYSYSASKAAVHMLTRHLAKRLAPEHITVNAIAPGPFESKMMAFLLDAPEGRAEVERQVPLGRIGQADDVAGLTVFLASRAGSYLTGAVIPLDGGITGCG
jgi:NAD(P)-dependent dehydrogenase (short-subunit alcohol dehydrogenase family)